MPSASLNVDWTQFQSATRQLQELLVSSQQLPVRQRKLIAEIVMVRLFLLAENTISSVCLKLLCGAGYLDGTRPLRLVGAPSLTTAQRLMKQYGRSRPRTTLCWTQAREIRRNLQYTLDSP